MEVFILLALMLWP